jgi:DeoR/GlpR family transcriptional regulator of sugar metabolism
MRSKSSHPENRPANSQARHEWIAQQVVAQGSVSIDDIVKEFGVARMTVHRDLDELEEQGVLRKIRNAATAQPSNLFESDVRYRLLQQKNAKALLAQTVMQFIEPGSSIFLDESTSLLPLAALLPTVGSLTVITNFLPLLQRVRRRENLRVIGLGGDLLNRFDSFSGLICERAVASMRADLYITSSTAVLGNNVFHPDEQVVRVKRTMMASATKRYLLADHTKFGKTALHEFASLTDFNAVIVDDQLDNKTIQQMRDAGVRVLIARRQSRERS